MCFFNISSSTEDKIATEDIITYKIVHKLPFINKIVFAPIYECTYYKNKLQKNINLEIEYILKNHKNEYSYFIHKGYYSILDLNKIKYNLLNDNLPKKLFMKLCIGKFIIPKGTKYHINNRSEIVSSQIYYTGEII